MPETIEKRTTKIPSCLVNKQLVQELGELLEGDKNFKGRLRYILDSRTRDMKSNEVKDFIEADWGSDLNKITIETMDYEYPQVEIKINFRHSSLSEYSLSSRDPTWSNGITSRVEKVFNNHKTNYHRIVAWYSKILLTIVIAIILA